MNETQPDKVFVKGMFFELPSGGSPEYVKGKLSCKVADLVQFLNDHQNVGGYVNIDLKVAKGGKAYAELNTWKPTDKQFKPKPAEVEQSEDTTEYPEGDTPDDDIPF